MHDQQASYRCCAIIPHYNHENTLGKVVEYVCSLNIPVIVVDDGSPLTVRKVVSDICDQIVNDAPLSALNLIQHEENLGKGGAVVSGLRYAAQQGYTHAIQVDADSQHDLNEIPKFLERSRVLPNALVLGKPYFDSSMPKIRYYGRYLTHFWVCINSLSRDVGDSMCGLRIYPVAQTLSIITASSGRIATHMGFDIEICVRSVWAGIQILNIPVRVFYPSEGISHFRPLLDNLEIVRMHIRCFFGMLTRAPRLIARVLRNH
ncbi:MAG: hypothetical protein DHS20C01_24780 [marine bacterium B5-7]|nr:MAG: hypothetical protein DHS20C01_24780 [marine bacterium B5-7]